MNLKRELKSCIAVIQSYFKLEKEHNSLRRKRKNELQNKTKGKKSKFLRMGEVRNR